MTNTSWNINININQLGEGNKHTFGIISGNGVKGTEISVFLHFILV